MKALMASVFLFTVSVVSAGQLNLVETVDGVVFDADEARVLYFANADNNLRILDRQSRDETIIDFPLVPGYGHGAGPRFAYLTPRGAIFVYAGQVHDYAAGELSSSFINSEVSLVVAGNYAIWNSNDILIRRDLVAGTNLIVSENTGNTDNDVTVDGDVAFWSGIGSGDPAIPDDYNVYFYQDGSITPVTQRSDLWSIYPVTDGTNFVYQRKPPCCVGTDNEIVFSGPDGEEILRPASASTSQPSPPYDYAVSNGWVVFTDLGVYDKQVIRRDPSGNRQPLSGWGEFAIESVSESGRVAFVDQSAWPFERYIYSDTFGSARANVDGGRGFWVGERFYVARDNELFASDDQPAAVTQRSVHCVGDANGDGLADIAAVMPDGTVVVRDVDDEPVSEFAFDSIAQIVDIEVMADTNTNGSPELVALGAGPMRAEVRDSLSGAQLSTVDFDPAITVIDLELIDDQTGNGMAELANLGVRPVSVQVSDALNSAVINTISFGNYFDPLDLEIYPDISGNGEPELAILGNNGGKEKGDKLEIRDLVSGELVREIYLSKDWKVLQQEPLDDIDGNGYPEAAIMRQRYRSERNHVVIRDTGPDKTSLGIVAFDRNYPPLKLLTVSDINGNGVDELAVYAQHYLGRSQKVKIKDSKTGKMLNAVFFDRNFVGHDVTTCADINGNGADELVLLGERADNGKLRAIVKDSKTDELLGKINF